MTGRRDNLGNPRKELGMPTQIHPVHPAGWLIYCPSVSWSLWPLESGQTLGNLYAVVVSHIRLTLIVGPEA
jgi:hypothetical protein